ncbi:MAG TPA: iron ABC transporter permease [Thermodesulfobacteriota bacterium]
MTVLDRAAPIVRHRGPLPLPAVGLAAAVCLVAALLGLGYGASDLGPMDVLGLAWRAATGRPVDATTAAIVLELRLPRVVAAMLVGAALAASGAVFQGLLRNPLADPYVVGVSSGAAAGAVLAICLGATGRVLGLPVVPASAFAGGLAAILVVDRIAQAAPASRALGTVLAGVVLSSLASAVIMLLITASPDPFVRGSLVWLMGDFGMVTPDGLPVLAFAVALGLAGVYAASRTLNLLALGDEAAHALGVEPGPARRRLFVLASLLTGVAVAAVGVVSFVGLIVPHAVRFVLGADHRRLVPFSAAFGGAFVVLADLVARVVAAPAELPIGAVTALCGAPFFLWLLVRRLPHA